MKFYIIIMNKYCVLILKFMAWCMVIKPVTVLALAAETLSLFMNITINDDEVAMVTVPISSFLCHEIMFWKMNNQLFISTDWQRQEMIKSLYLRTYKAINILKTLITQLIHKKKKKKNKTILEYEGHEPDQTVPVHLRNIYNDKQEVMKGMKLM